MKTTIASILLGAYFVLAHSVPVLASVAPLIASHLQLVSIAMVDAMSGGAYSDSILGD